jgi:hypothetical protein
LPSASTRRNTASAAPRRGYAPAPRQHAVAVGTPRVEAAVLRQVVGRRRRRPRIAARRVDQDRPLAHRDRAAVVDRHAHRHRAAPLRPFEHQRIAVAMVHGREPVDPPRDTQRAGVSGGEFGGVGDRRAQPQRRAAVPPRRPVERCDRVGDRLGHRDRHVDRARRVGERRAQLQRHRLIAGHAPWRERDGELVHGEHGCIAVALQQPRDLLCAAGLRGHRRRPALGDAQRRHRGRERVARRDDRPDQRRQRALVLVLQPDPLRRTRDVADAHLVDVAAEAVAVPAADVQPHRRRDVEQRRRGAGEHAVDVDARVVAPVGVHDVQPLAERHRLPALDVGEVALDRHARRAQQVEHHLAGPLLLAPREHRRVDALGPEPRLRRAVRRALGEAGDGVAAEQAVVAVQAPRWADPAGGRRRALVLQLHRADGVAQRRVEVQHADVAVPGSEHRAAVRGAARLGVAPVQAQPLPGVADDLRHAHPHGGLAGGGVPLLDLEAERRAGVVGDAQVLAVRLRRREVEDALAQPQQQREVGDARVRRQRRPLGVGQDPALAVASPLAEVGRWRRLLRRGQRPEQGPCERAGGTPREDRADHATRAVPTRRGAQTPWPCPSCDAGKRPEASRVPPAAIAPPCDLCRGCPRDTALHEPDAGPRCTCTAPVSDWVQIQWFATLDRSLAEARRTGRPILYARAAPHCAGVLGMWWPGKVTMDRSCLSQPEVIAAADVPGQDGRPCTRERAIESRDPRRADSPSPMEQ